jgi:hypothetical protein
MKKEDFCCAIAIALLLVLTRGLAPLTAVGIGTPLLLFVVLWAAWRFGNEPDSDAKDRAQR